MLQELAFIFSAEINPCVSKPLVSMCWYGLEFPLPLMSKITLPHLHLGVSTFFLFIMHLTRNLMVSQNYCTPPLYESPSFLAIKLWSLTSKTCYFSQVSPNLSSHLLLLQPTSFVYQKINVRPKLFLGLWQREELIPMIYYCGWAF